MISRKPKQVTLMRAYQYAYYVHGISIVSDYEYDMFCKEHGLFGGGGSDREEDYSPDEIDQALELIECRKLTNG